MNKTVDAIFADRAKAYEGVLALEHLAAKGVEVHASASGGRYCPAQALETHAGKSLLARECSNLRSV
jgi:hypothetical protein